MSEQPAELNQVEPAQVSVQGVDASAAESSGGYDEFEMGEHEIPWFLWFFFALIIAWAAVSWIKFFGY